MTWSLERIACFWAGLGVMVAYVPGFTDTAIPTGWAFLWIAIPLLLIVWHFRGHNISMTGAHWLGLLFLGYCILSLIWADDLYGAGAALFELGPFVLVFIWASSLDDALPIYLGMACGLAINDLVAIAQVFGFEAIGQISRPAGLFVSKNVFGEISALIAIALVAKGRWRWLALALPGLLLTGARGAWAALLVAAVIALWRLNRFAALALLLIPIAATVITLASNYRTASLSERFDWSADTVSGLTLLGHGIGSFQQDFPLFASRSDTSTRRPDHLHDDFLELAFETGIGFAFAGIFIMACLQGNLWAERLVLAGFVLIALFEIPLHVPAETFLGAVVAGRLARARTMAWPQLGLRGPA